MTMNAATPTWTPRRGTQNTYMVPRNNKRNKIRGRTDKTNRVYRIQCNAAKTATKNTSTTRTKTQRSSRAAERGDKAAEKAAAEKTKAVDTGSKPAEDDEYEYVVEEVSVVVDAKGNEIRVLDEDSDAAAVAVDAVRADVDLGAEYRDKAESRVKAATDVVVDETRKTTSEVGGLVTKVLKGSTSVVSDLSPSSIANMSFGSKCMLGIPIAVLGVSFASAVATVLNRRYNKLGRRKVAVTKNMIVIESLSAYFPERRGDLNHAIIKDIRSKTGFGDEEIFRKYLRFFLDKRELNRETAADVFALRAVCNLNAQSFFRVLSETAERYVHMRCDDTMIDHNSQATHPFRTDRRRRSPHSMRMHSHTSTRDDSFRICWCTHTYAHTHTYTHAHTHMYAHSGHRSATVFS